MKNLNMLKNKGYSLFTIFVILVVAGFGTVYGGKAGMYFYESKTIKNTIAELKVPAKSSTAQVKNLFSQQLSINNIIVPAEDITVVKAGPTFNIAVDFVREIGINEKIKLTLDFSVSEDTLVE